jgi:integral membrane protein (TIGR01906 family)
MGFKNSWSARHACSGSHSGFLLECLWMEDPEKVKRRSNALYLPTLNMLVILLIPLLLVLGSVRLLVTDQYLAFEYGKASFPLDLYGFDQSQRMDYASSNFHYVRKNLPVEFLQSQELGSQQLYNEREVKHMQDVQNVYQITWRLWLVSLGLFGLAVLGHLHRRVTWPDLGKSLILGGLLTTGLITLIGLLAVIAWQAWFLAFHQVFFAAGTWVFDPSDMLIRLFPEKFWFDAALTISGLSLAGGLAAALFGVGLRKLDGRLRPEN